MATTEPDKGVRSFGLGSRSGKLDSLFPNSPMYNSYTPESVEKIQKIFLQGFEASYGDTTDGITNDSGHMFGTFDLNFNGRDDGKLPDLADVETGGGGLPSSPFTPNLSAPGEGSFNAADQVEHEAPTSRTQFGSGQGGAVSPSKTSPEIAGQTIGSLLSGKSYLGSDGQV
jgi:hypothetical protein